MNVTIYPMLIKVTILINNKKRDDVSRKKIKHEIIELLSSKSQIIILNFEACLSPNQTKNCHSLLSDRCVCVECGELEKQFYINFSVYCTPRCRTRDCLLAPGIPTPVHTPTRTKNKLKLKN